MPSLATLSWSRFIVELRQFYRIPEAAFFTFLLPVLMLFLFTVLFSGVEIDGPPGEEKVNLSQYFVAGMIAVGMMSTTFQYLAISVSIEQHNGLLKRLGGTPLPRTAYFAGKIGLVFVITLVQGTIMLAYGVIVGGVQLPSDPERWGVFALIVVLGSAAFSLMGIAYTRLIPNEKAASAMVVPPYLVLQFISGIFFLLSDLPSGLRAVASVFPLLWLARGLRYVFLPDWFQSEEPGGTWSVEWVVLVLVAWVIVGFVASLVFFRWTRRADG